MKILAAALWAATTWSACFLVACGDDAMKTTSGPDKADAAAPDDTTTGDAQTPAHGAAAIKTWLADAAYRDWACEPAVHEARSPSPHGFNRICSNDVLSAHATEDGDWPKGAAAVKELHASADSTTPVGYAVYEKTATDSAGGDNWYWYEVVPSDSAAPHDSKGVVADGFGSEGTAKSICVGCHGAAGSDTAHTPSPGARDQVYTPVTN